MNDIPELSQLAQTIAVGAEYRHFKGGRYTVIAIARDSEDLREMVVYQALYDPSMYFVRSVEDFTKTIEREGVEIKRFERETVR
jgi:hypothetical protein